MLLLAQITPLPVIPATTSLTTINHHHHHHHHHHQLPPPPTTTTTTSTKARTMRTSTTQAWKAVVDGKDDLPKGSLIPPANFQTPPIPRITLKPGILCESLGASWRQVVRNASPIQTLTQGASNATRTSQKHLCKGF